MNEDVIFEAAAKSDSSSTDSGFASSIKRGGRKVLVVFRPLEDEDEDGLIDNESDSDYGSEDAVDRKGILRARALRNQLQGAHLPRRQIEPGRAPKDIPVT